MMLLVDHAGQAPGDPRLERLGVLGGDDPLLLPALEVQVHPAQTQRVSLRPAPIHLAEQVAGGLAGLDAVLEPQ